MTVGLNRITPPLPPTPQSTKEGAAPPSLKDTVGRMYAALEGITRLHNSRERAKRARRIAFWVLSGAVTEDNVEAIARYEVLLRHPPPCALRPTLVGDQESRLRLYKLQGARSNTVPC